MDFSNGGAGVSGDEQDNSQKGKRAYHRLNSYQTAILENFIKEWPHPNESQRRQLASEVGLETKQIKFWFQNKRTQMKAQNERADNATLRFENERMQRENQVIRDALKAVVCPSCGGPPFGEEEHKLCLQKLKQENAILKDEHEKVSNLLSRYLEKPRSQAHQLLAPTITGPSYNIPVPTTQPELQAPIIGPSSSSYDPALGSSQNQSTESSCRNQDFVPPMIPDDAILPHNPTSVSADMEKALMAEVATTAMEELVRLLRINEPLWVKSSPDGKMVLHRESYEKIFTRAYHFKSSNALLESTKESRIVSINGMQLVDMFFNSEKWANLFPRIITKAQTVQVLERGLPENRSGALQLMYEEMHILSPLVPSREFYFLRYCQQLDVGVWVITDVSFDSFKENIPPSCSWRHPSGCMIHEMPNGSSMVTWVEHVEVEDKIQTHRLYRDLVCGNIGYGAERWLMELQRMCERFAYFSVENIPSHDAGGVIKLIEGRRSVMRLSHRMVRSFCRTLAMSRKMDFSHSAEVDNNGVKVSVRKNTEPGQPHGMIVSAATSLWLPLPPPIVFEFFRDQKKRVLWDVLSCGNPVHEIAHISSGTHPGNCISIIRPFIPTENSVLILQESFIDSSGSYVVYAPADVADINVAIRGEDSSAVPILPCGFVISEDGRSNAVAGASTSESVGRPAGSLLTVAYQILVCSPAAIRQVNMEYVAAINTLITSTVQKIKDALNCSGFE